MWAPRLRALAWLYLDLKHTDTGREGRCMGPEYGEGEPLDYPEGGLRRAAIVLGKLLLLNQEGSQNWGP